MRTHALLIFAFFLWIDGHAFAQQLTLREVLQTAMERSGEVLTVRQENHALNSEYQSTLGAFDPNWKTSTLVNSFGLYENVHVDTSIEKPFGPLSSSFFAGYRWSDGKFSIYDGKMETGEQGEARVGARFSLWRNRGIDRRRVLMSSAKLGQRIGEASLRQTTLSVLRETSKKYWDFTLSHQRLKVAQKLLKAAEDRQRFLEVRYQHGDIAKFDVDDNVRSMLQRKAQVVHAGRQVQAEANRLSLLMQSAVDPAVETEGELLEKTESEILSALPAFSELVAAAKENRPDYIRIHSQIEQQKIDVRYYKNTADPKLDVQFAGSRDFGEGKIPLSESNLETYLWFEVPLQRREAQGKRGVALAKMKRLEIQRELLNRQIETEVRDLIQGFEALVSRVKLAKQEREVAQMLEDGERKKFFQGESNFIFLNIREQNLFDASMRYLEVLVEYRKLRADLLAVVAAPEGDWFRN